MTYMAYIEVPLYQLQTRTFWLEIYHTSLTEPKLNIKQNNILCHISYLKATYVQKHVYSYIPCFYRPIHYTLTPKNISNMKYS